MVATPKAVEEAGEDCRRGLRGGRRGPKKVFEALVSFDLFRRPASVEERLDGIVGLVGSLVALEKVPDGI